jgi:glycosyltransferase involved in cell wall biosynthesis
VTNQFIIVDPNLRDIGGHYAEYDRAVVAGAKDEGYDVTVLAHQAITPSLRDSLGATPTFTREIWGSAPTGSRLRRAFALLADNFTFLREILRGLRTLPRGAQDVIFAHTFIRNQFFALALLPLLLRRRWNPRLVYLFRYQPDFYHGRLSRMGFWLLRRLMRRHDIRFTTDSARLAEQLEVLAGVVVETLPIPHTPKLAPNLSHPDSDVTTFVSLGSAREEKGILEILQAIALLHEQGRAVGMRFVLQCNDAEPSVVAAIEAFRKNLLPGCELIDQALSSENYYALLRAANVVLLPYRRSIYFARTSGVLVEALALGKPIIATDDTWMTDQLLGTGLPTRDRSARHLAEVMVNARNNVVELAARARTRQEHWLATHNPKALIHAIRALSGQRRPPAMPPRRVLVLYPHDDALANQRGSSRRVNLLIDTLTRWGLEVRVLQGGTAPRETVNGTIVESLGAEPRLFCRQLASLAVVWLASLGRGLRHWWIFWHFIRIGGWGEFRARLGQHIAWSDIVFLEYPFWAKPVVAIARRLDRRVILTSYDILADQMEELPWLRAMVQRMESRAFRLADHVCMVSADDLPHVNGVVPRPVLAPNPTHGRMFELARLVAPRDLLRDVYGFVAPAGRFGLFVGSAHEPNRQAAAVIRGFGPELGPDDIGFVVAGACAEPGLDANILSLGRVDDAMLPLLYAACDFVIVPIPSGTGASLKTVEAMAAGKAVLGTQVAFRGLAVRAGHEALIEDRTERYPDLSRTLLRDATARERLGGAARTFALSYDARVAFLPYRNLLGLAPLENPPITEGSLDTTLIALAHRAKAAGQVAVAETLAREALRTSPTHQEALAMVADQPIPPDPGRDALAIWLGSRDDTAQCLRAGLYGAAIDRARAVLTYEPELLDARLILAEALGRSGAPLPEVLAAYRAVDALGYDLYWLRVRIGETFLYRGDLPRAGWMFMNAFRLRPFRRHNLRVLRDFVKTALGG